MASSETPKILVVDDDMRLRALLERYLVEQGYIVRSVANYEQMQRLMERDPAVGLITTSFLLMMWRFTSLLASCLQMA